MYKNRSKHSHSTGRVSVAPLPSKTPPKYENPKLIWLQCFGTFGIRQTQRSIFLLPSCSSEQRVCLCQPLNGGLPGSVFAGQLRRNSIVCPTEFYGETSPSCCFLGDLPCKVQVPEGRGVTFNFSAAILTALMYIYINTYDVNHMNICVLLANVEDQPSPAAWHLGNGLRQTKQPCDQSSSEDTPLKCVSFHCRHDD